MGFPLGGGGARPALPPRAGRGRGSRTPPGPPGPAPRVGPCNVKGSKGPRGLPEASETDCESKRVFKLAGDPAVTAVRATQWRKTRGRGQDAKTTQKPWLFYFQKQRWSDRLSFKSRKGCGSLSRSTAYLQSDGDRQSQTGAGNGASVVEWTRGWLISSERRQGSLTEQLHLQAGDPRPRHLKAFLVDVMMSRGRGQVTF